MTKNKWKSYAKMLGFMIAGGVLGASMNMAISGVGKENVRSFAREIQNWIQDQYLPLGICFAVFVLAVNIVGLLYARKLFKSEEKSEDDDILDQLEGKVQI